MSVDESNGTEVEKDNSDGKPLKPDYLFDVVVMENIISYDFLSYILNS